jgi:hypothetical protein
VLPYNQVAELDPLKDYFLVLGIDNVSELGEGARNPPKEGSQVTIGHLSLANVGYKESACASSNPKTPYITTTHKSQDDFITCVAHTTPPTTMAPILTHIGAHCYTLPNGLSDGDLMVMLNMLHAYLEHNAHLRSGTAADHASPDGYGNFALSFNMLQTTNGLTTWVAEESSEGPRISGPSPSITNLIGKEVQSAQPIHSCASQPPPDG